MKVGWLVDESQYIGGAELSMAVLREHASEDIIDCAPGAVVSGCDIYVIGNCVNYDAGEVIAAVEGKPTVKRVADFWPHGSSELRKWLLDKASAVIFLSPPHFLRFPYNVGVPIKYVPPPLDYTVFREAGKGSTTRRGTFWLGQMTDTRKGITEAIKWANKNKVRVDFYGDGPFRPSESEYVHWCGEIPYDDVPGMMASYDRMVFLPVRDEAFGRVVMEAFAAGCKVVTNRVPGCVWYLEHDPRSLWEDNVEGFWNVVRAVSRYGRVTA